MIEKILFFLKKNGYANAQNEELLRFGIEKTAGIIIDFSSTVILGILLKIVIESIVYWITIFLLRIYVGGYHARKRSICMVISFTSTIVSLLYINSECESMIFLLFAIGMGTICFICAPVEAINKPLSKKERKVFGVYGRGLIIINICKFCFGWKRGWSAIYRPIMVAIIMTGMGVIAEKFVRKMLKRAS